jgi:glutaminyl-tRNA synthetase
MYDRLFSAALPGKEHEDGDFLKDLNPASLKIIKNALVEPSLAACAAGTHVQFERVGYFYSDPVDSKGGAGGAAKSLVFNRVVTLRDNWAAGATAGSTAGATAPASTPAAAGKNAAAKPAAAAPAPAAAAPAGGGEGVEDIRRLDIRVGKILSAMQVLS